MRTALLYSSGYVGLNRVRGAAMITALFVVTLSAMLVSGLLWRQQIQIRRIENQQMILQAQWVQRGALDWTRFILRAAADTSPIDYLGGIWAVPIAQTRLSDLLGRAGAAGEAYGQDTYLSGSIEDAQAKFNLRNLVKMPRSGQLVLDVVQIASFERLLAILNLKPELAKVVALQLRASLMHAGQLFPERANPKLKISAGSDNLESQAEDQLLPVNSVAGLLDIPGFTAEIVEQLKPFVTVLPQPTTVNVNTVSAEVLASMIPGFDVAKAQMLLALREQVFFVNTGDFTNRLRTIAGSQLEFDTSQFDVKTNFFVIHGHVQYDRALLLRDVLVYRHSSTHSTRIISMRDAI
ncbi:type II secretion system minor pseudopilin GspK [Mycoavidus sp. SF9855]|uniref:type II secretion system minor pseudopilin GspK n=1 Tax=Mycoavidus sp. SF9855 TaxID=2968475 RepID=UPI00211C9B98|nr:type II secretion system minor pseudopilin GspK [Mycoavidus sp. SF9855]UUM21612.1 type II secretion system minor pseudopilin GspK [Mycoavidus sp. SF9855]